MSFMSFGLNKGVELVHGSSHKWTPSELSAFKNVSHRGHLGCKRWIRDAQLTKNIVNSRDTAILDDLIFAAIMAITEWSTTKSYVSQVLIIQWSWCKSVQVENAESRSLSDYI